METSLMSESLVDSSDVEESVTQGKWQNFIGDTACFFSVKESRVGTHCTHMVRSESGASQDRFF